VISLSLCALKSYTLYITVYIIDINFNTKLESSLHITLASNKVVLIILLSYLYFPCFFIQFCNCLLPVLVLRYSVCWLSYIFPDLSFADSIFILFFLHDDFCVLSAIVFPTRINTKSLIEIWKTLTEYSDNQCIRKNFISNLNINKIPNENMPSTSFSSEICVSPVIPS